MQKYKNWHTYHIIIISFFALLVVFLFWFNVEPYYTYTFLSILQDC